MNGLFKKASFCMFRSTSPPLAAIALLAVLSGCSNERFTYAPVSGTVTLDGAPLAKARVIFAPKPDQKNDGQTGRLSFCVTDQNGKFDLMTVGDEKGARVGMHAVAICGEVRDEANPEKILRAEYLPARYYGGKTLTFEVPPLGTSEANFALTSGK